MNHSKHIISFIFYLVLLVKGNLPSQSYAQENEQLSFLTIDNAQVIYRGYDSMFEYGAHCLELCDSYIEASGGTVRFIESSDAPFKRAIFKPDSISDQAILDFYAICSNDTILLLTKQYPIISIPHPHIYYGGINLTDYTIYDTIIAFDTTGLHAKYYHVPAIGHTAAFIQSCAITYNNVDYNMVEFPRQIPPEIINGIKRGEKIYLNSVEMRYVDGRFVTLYLKRELIKTSIRNKNVFILR